MQPPIHRILLADDELADQLLNRQTLERVLAPGSTINLVGSGQEAIAYLIGEGRFADRSRYPFPTLILCDLNMPNGDGFDVLEFLRANPAWSVVPRIICSTSHEDDDVRTAYQLGASAYHVKPSGLDALEAQVRLILQYWAGAEAPPVDVTGRLLVSHRAGRRGTRFPPPQGGPATQRPEAPSAEPGG